MWTISNEPKGSHTPLASQHLHPKVTLFRLLSHRLGLLLSSCKWNRREGASRRLVAGMVCCCESQPRCCRRQGFILFLRYGMPSASKFLEGFHVCALLQISVICTGHRDADLHAQAVFSSGVRLSLSHQSNHTGVDIMILWG